MNAAAALTICEFISFWISPLACMLLPKNVNGGIFVLLLPSQVVLKLGVKRALIRFTFPNCLLTPLLVPVLNKPLIFACGLISNLQWLYCQFSVLWLNYVNFAYAFLWYWYHWQCLMKGKKTLLCLPLVSIQPFAWVPGFPDWMCCLWVLPQCLQSNSWGRQICTALQHVPKLILHIYRLRCSIVASKHTCFQSYINAFIGFSDFQSIFVNSSVCDNSIFSQHSAEWKLDQVPGWSRLSAPAAQPHSAMSDMPLPWLPRSSLLARRLQQFSLLEHFIPVSRPEGPLSGWIQPWKFFHGYT